MCQRAEGDSEALRESAGRGSVLRRVPKPACRENREQVPLLTEVVKSRLPVGGSVGVLGLAYKPDTDVVEESQGLAFTQSLLDAGIPVIVYDPAASDNAKRALTGSVRFASSAAECCRDADDQCDAARDRGCHAGGDGDSGTRRDGNS